MQMLQTPYGNTALKYELYKHNNYLFLYHLLTSYEHAQYRKLTSSSNGNSLNNFMFVEGELATETFNRRGQSGGCMPRIPLDKFPNSIYCKGVLLNNNN